MPNSIIIKDKEARLLVTYYHQNNQLQHTNTQRYSLVLMQAPPYSQCNIENMGEPGDN
jgi:hypothetical protein